MFVAVGSSHRTVFQFWAFHKLMPRPNALQVCIWKRLLVITWNGHWTNGLDVSKYVWQFGAVALDRKHYIIEVPLTTCNHWTGDRAPPCINICYYFATWNCWKMGGMYYNYFWLVHFVTLGMWAPRIINTSTASRNAIVFCSKFKLGLTRVSVGSPNAI